MRKDKTKALELRLQGKSYAEISKVMHIPKSTLSTWLATSPESMTVKQALKVKATDIGRSNLITLAGKRKNQLDSIYKQAETEAVNEFKIFKHHPLFIASLGIYWGEGNKATPGLVYLGNTDPKMLKIFYIFLKEICGVEENKIRAYVHIYPDLNNSECIDYWVAQIGLSRYNFNKSVLIPGRHKNRRLQYGICNIGTASTFLKRKINVWIELLATEFANND